ncbi:MAG: DUF2277 domain-containing protein [Anaerolineaceae bacterium]|nr:DUF2277 domain-containing protein [Anaerolineaceae bacterium]
MCRSIQTLYNRQPPPSEEEIQAAALQYVRKLSGYRKPSRANQAAFQAAVDAVAAATSILLNSLETNAPPRPAGRAQGNAQTSKIHSQPLRPAELDTGVE